jgi:hypothetical protein
MSQSSASPSNSEQAANAPEPPAPKLGRHVCPFCGTVREQRSTPCPRCTMEDSTATRQATRARIGPWYVLQQRNPSAPGMRFDMLLTLVKRGQVSPRSIVRGPTTHQLWRFAGRVRGLSREFGLCYSCSAKIDPAATLCGECHKMQEPPMNPDVLLESKPPGKSIPAVRREIPPPPRPADEHDAATDLVLPTLGALNTGAATVKSTNPPAGSSTTPPPAKPSTALMRAESPRRPENPPRAIPPAAAPAERKEETRSVKTTPVPLSPGRAEPKKPAAGEAKGRVAAQGRPARAAAASSAADASDASVDSGARPILSAKELAAAFRLDFIPQPGQSSVATATGTAPSKRRRLPWVLALLILLGGGAAAALYLNPALRQRVADWSNQTYLRLHDKWSAIQNGSHGLPKPGKSPNQTPNRTPPQSAVPSSDDSSRASVKPAPDNAGNAAAPRAAKGDDLFPASGTSAPLTLRHLPVPGVGQKVNTQVTGNDADASANHADETSKSQPAAAPPSANPGPWDQLKQAAESPVAPVVKSTAQPAPAVPPTSAQPAPTPPAPAAATPAPKETAPLDASGDYSEKIRQLWIAAIDAEGNNNYRQAVQLYEEIQQYPRDQWPVSLELRLEQVKRQIREDKK